MAPQEDMVRELGGAAAGARELDQEEEVVAADECGVVDQPPVLVA